MTNLIVISPEQNLWEIHSVPPQLRQLTRQAQLQAILKELPQATFIALVEEVPYGE